MQHTIRFSPMSYSTLRTEALDDGGMVVLEPYYGYGVHIPAGFKYTASDKYPSVASCVYSYLRSQATNPVELEYAHRMYYSILRHHGALSWARICMGYVRAVLWGVLQNYNRRTNATYQQQ